MSALQKQSQVLTSNYWGHTPDINLDMVLVRAALGSPYSSQTESDHRIANNLSVIASLVRSQARSLSAGAPLPPEAVATILGEVATRIEAVARLHRLLADQSDNALIDLPSYLQEVVELARQAFDASGRFAVHCAAAAPIQTAASKAGLIGLIVSEAVVNAFKYAHPAGVSGEVRVNAHPIGSTGMLISVEDDGVGLPDGFDPTKDGGVGLRVIASLAKQLDGSVTFRSSGVGLSIQLLIGADGAS